MLLSAILDFHPLFLVAILDILEIDISGTKFFPGPHFFQDLCFWDQMEERRKGGKKKKGKKERGKKERGKKERPIVDIECCPA